ncbi:MAG: PHB depolymerase family esterase [Gemmataceae bacterium]
MCRFAVAILGCLLLAASARAGEVRHGFVDKVHKSAKGDSKYVVFVPHSYTGEKEFPIILFLHGAGERGDDGQAQVLQGIGNAIKFKGKDKKFPFFVVFPQAVKGGNWKAGGPDAERALAILAEVQKAYKIDPARVYLTGLSMGGSGTWSLAAAYPERWAAIVPICGGGDPGAIEKIKHIPCWCFVGDKDNSKLVENNRAMVKGLGAAGAQVRYTEFPFIGHNSWDPAYVMDELYAWLVAHTLKR